MGTLLIALGVISVASAPAIHRALIARQIRYLTSELEQRQWAAFGDALAPAFVLHVAGSSALGGRFETLAATELWWNRVWLQFPVIRIEITELLVAGPPWATRVALRAVISGGRADGIPYTEEITAASLELRFGKITTIAAIPDTWRLERGLNAIASVGLAKAKRESRVEHGQL